MIRYAAIYIFSVFIAAISQILLKSSAQKKYKNFIEEYMNFRVIFAYLILFISSLLTIFAYQCVPLSLGMVLESSGYIFITILGYLFLHETIGKRGAVGMMCILAGIVIVYF